jgi:hypothetical protein
MDQRSMARTTDGPFHAYTDGLAFRVRSALSRARSSVGERSLHTREVAGSKPAVPMLKEDFA